MGLINSGHRDCINCGSDNPETMFSFTRKFLNEVRGQSLEELNAFGIGENFSTTIVKCKDCGCDYIRDVANFRENLINNPDWTDDKINKTLTDYRNGFSRIQINHITYTQSVITNLIKLVLKKKKSNSELSLLDFGCSLSLYSPLARLMGFSEVTAFDPHYPRNISKLKSSDSIVNFKFISDRKDAIANAPYDAIICNSADEHFFDLQGEIKFMHDLLADDGVLYISHPILDLDANIHHLRNEANIKDQKLLRLLRASFYINHLNYVKPKMFKEMLKKNGFKELKVVRIQKSNLDVGFFHKSNLLLYLKSYTKYVLGLFGNNYRKTEFFLEKIK